MNLPVVSSVGYPPGAEDLAELNLVSGRSVTASTNYRTISGT